MNEFDQTQETTGVPQEGDEGKDSRPTEFQPVDNPVQPEGGEYENVDAKKSDADFDVEERNEEG